MKCILCGKTNLLILKNIHGRRIFECTSCQLGATERKQDSKPYKGNLYNVRLYDKNRKKHERQFQRIISCLTSYIQKGRVLDVGAGYGLFSWLLSQTGRYEIDAVEPFLPVKYLKNPDGNIFKQSFEEFEKNNKHSNQYDVIIFLDVLEHFDNPIIILQQTKKLLKENGSIVIQIPNYKSFMAKICRNWAWFMVEDHRFHFSPKSIQLLLKRVGFQIVKTRSYESFEDFKKNFDGNFEELQTPRRKYIKILIYPIFFTFYIIFRRFVWLLKRGGLLLIVAKITRKPQ